MTELSSEKMIEILRTMLKIRYFELRVKELVLKGTNVMDLILVLVKQE